MICLGFWRRRYLIKMESSCLNKILDTIILRKYDTFGLASASSIGGRDIAKNETIIYSKLLKISINA